MSGGHPYILVGAAILLASGALLGLVHFWRRRVAVIRAARGKSAPRHPIVLAHGVMGFDEFQFGPLRSAYFKGIAQTLERMGAKVYTVKVSPSASVTERAEQLATAVRAIPARKVNIIAHSMGGLDARYAISRLSLAGKVASLTTIGTPHRGTPLADVGTGVGTRLGLRRILRALGLEVEAFYDLTTAKMSAFNLSVPDMPGVHYGSVVAAAPRRITRLNPLLLPAHMFLSQRYGANDGIVTTDSQQWGELLSRIEADHWAQIGWSRRFDAPALFAQIASALRSRGL